MNFTREQLQNYATEYAFKNHKCLVTYAPGFGKSKIACDLIQKVRNHLTRRLNILIVCHSEISRDETWPKELEKWGLDTLRVGGQVRLITYRSPKQMLGVTWDVIILDEAHYITEAFAEYYNYTVRSIVLGLTATPPIGDDAKMKLFNSIFGNHMLQMHVDKAIQDQVLNDYIIKIFEYDIQGEELTKYIDLCKWVQQEEAKGNQFGIRNSKIQRMMYLQRLESKKLAVRHLMDKLGPNVKKLVMVGSIEMADSLSPYVYHSKTTDENFKRFCNDEIPELVSIKQIKEGANIPNLGYLISAAVDSKRINFIQILGRLLRQNIDDVSELWLVCAANTMDASWIRKASAGLDKSKIFRVPLNL